MGWCLYVPGYVRHQVRLARLDTQCYPLVSEVHFSVKAEEAAALVAASAAASSAFVAFFKASLAFFPAGATEYEAFICN